MAALPDINQNIGAVVFRIIETRKWRSFFGLMHKTESAKDNLKVITVHHQQIPTLHRYHVRHQSF
jgi:hypothetical protein